MLRSCREAPSKLFGVSRSCNGGTVETAWRFALAVLCPTLDTASAKRQAASTVDGDDLSPLQRGASAKRQAASTAPRADARVTPARSERETPGRFLGASALVPHLLHFLPPVHLDSVSSPCIDLCIP